METIPSDSIIHAQDHYSKWWARRVGRSPGQSAKTLTRTPLGPSHAAWQALRSLPDVRTALTARAAETLPLVPRLLARQVFVLRIQAFSRL